MQKWEYKTFRADRDDYKGFPADALQSIASVQMIYPSMYT